MSPSHELENAVYSVIPLVVTVATSGIERQCVRVEGGKKKRLLQMLQPLGKRDSAGEEWEVNRYHSREVYLVEYERARFKLKRTLRKTRDYFSSPIFYQYLRFKYKF